MRPTSTSSRSATPATTPPTPAATREEAARGVTTRRPRMFGFQAAGSAPIVLGEVVKNPDTIASAIRIGNPASWELALDGARRDRRLLRRDR